MGTLDDIGNNAKQATDEFLAKQKAKIEQDKQDAKETEARMKSGETVDDQQTS